MLEFARFLKGKYHYQLQARCEEDIDEDDITKQLTIATGSNFDAGQVKQGAQFSTEKKKTYQTDTGMDVEASKSVNIFYYDLFFFGG